MQHDVRRDEGDRQHPGHHDAERDEDAEHLHRRDGGQRQRGEAGTVVSEV